MGSRAAQETTRPTHLDALGDEIRMDPRAAIPTSTRLVRRADQQTKTAYETALPLAEQTAD